MKKYIISILLLIGGLLQAQEYNTPIRFIPPFDFPLYLSGNFGELRSNHFHGGIDFKTEGVEGKPVRAIEEGYVSRISVSPGGYGNALYVTHPNGYTSVYGHLRNFVGPIADFVEEFQYENELFAVNIEPDSSHFVFKRGEVIAYGGNTGHSFGPHLHMEIRITETNELIDPLQFYMNKIKDDKPPVAKSIMFYPQRNTGVVEGKTSKQAFTVDNANKYTCIKPVEAWGEIGIGISAFDYMTGTSNNYGVQSLTLYVDSAMVFNSTIDKYSLDENRMINSWTDYTEFRLRRNWYMKSFIEPGNPLRMLHVENNRGIISIDEERDYRFMYILKDLYGNSSVYEFTVRGKEQEIPKTLKGKHFLKWDRSNIVQEPGMHFIIPRGMLYDDVDLNTKVSFDSSAVAFEYQIHNVPVPLHRACDLLIGIRNMKIEDTSKYYVARKNGNRYQYVGGKYEDGWMRASVNELGTYTIAIDTVPPKVEAVNQASWKKTGAITYKISDAETGIKKYEGQIDGEFVLFELDAKSGRFSYKPNSRRPLKPGKHTVTITVEDNCGNVTRREDGVSW